MRVEGEAEALLQGEEADGLPEAAEGDMEGAEIGGGVVETVQTGGQDVQVVQEGLLLGLMGPVFLEGQLLLKVAGVAAEGRGGKAVLGGQGAARKPGKEGAIDGGAGGVGADGAAFVHLEAIFRFPFLVFRKRIGGKDIRGGSGGPERVGRVAGKP